MSTKQVTGPIKIQTPARLHFGLLDLNGGLGRIDGGIGLALEEPRTVVSASRGPAVEVACPMDRDFEDRLCAAARAVCESYALPGASVRVLARAKPHSGLGSASQTLVGAGIAICALYGRKAPASEIAALVGRGGTSGIGVGAIETGGFVLDGGHRFRRGRGSKVGYSPSSASVGVSPPPVLARYNFPDWDVLIVIPRGEGASGERERDLFEEACPIADRDVEKMSRILLVQMLPALLEADLPAFGAALEAYQSYGFKRFEFNTQGPLIPECVEFLRVNGGVGVGMSSWGPSLHAFGRDLSGLRLKAREWLSARGGGEVVLTRANNEGYRLIPAGEAKAGAAASGSSRRETEIARPK
ncbi:MAG: hypothetical protein OXL39_04100 [Caldilineaceae bacterium]|nr:hypothetical protein [Caldilineaceae bacterium]